MPLPPQWLQAVAATRLAESDAAGDAIRCRERDQSGWAWDGIETATSSGGGEAAAWAAEEG